MRTGLCAFRKIQISVITCLAILTGASVPPVARADTNEKLIRSSYRYPVRVHYTYLGCRAHCYSHYRSFGQLRSADCPTKVRFTFDGLKKRFYVGYLEIQASGHVTFRGPATLVTCYLIETISLINQAVVVDGAVPLFYHVCPSDRFHPCQATESGHPGIAAAVMQFYSIPSDLYPTRVEEGVAGQ